MRSLTSGKGKYRVRYSLQIYHSQPLHCSLPQQILGNIGIGCWKHTLLSRSSDLQLNNQEEHSLPQSSQDYRHKCLVPRSDHALWETTIHHPREKKKIYNDTIIKKGQTKGIELNIWLRFLKGLLALISSVSQPSSTAIFCKLELHACIALLA